LFFKTIAREEGVFGVYKGFQSPIVGFSALNAMLFWGYGLGKKVASNINVGEKPDLYDSNGVRRMSVTQNIIAAAIGGSIVSWVEGPVDFMKCQLQTRFKEYNGFFDCGRKIYRKKGVSGLLQGHVATQIRNIPGYIFYFGFYEAVKNYYSKKTGLPVDKLPSYYVLLAGGAGGLGFWFLCYPLDVVKSTLQSDSIDPSQRKYSGYLDVVRKLWRTEGIKGFVKGYIPCMCRSFPANAVCFFGYEYSLRVFNSVGIKD